MKLGTENKKALYALVILGGGALYGVYSSLFSGPSVTTSATPAPAPTAAVALPSADSDSGPARIPSGRSEEFKPKLRSKRPEDRIDPTHVDPTLRLDLLAKLQQVPAAGGTHNLFQISAPPPTVAKPTGPETKIALASKWGPTPLPPPPGPPPPPPPKVPVPAGVKYYGWAAPSGSQRRKAFFLDGEDVVVKLEGETIKGHYRIVRIGPTSVVLEDTNDKLQQTLTKVEDAA